jgi:thioesterase domain-containing protein
MWAIAFGAHAGVPDYQAFPADGSRLLLWVASERGRAEPELQAARQLAAQGVEVWSLDLVDAYFLPQLPSSMDAVPVRDLADWLRAAQAGGKRVTVYAVARAAAPLLRAAASLDAAGRQGLCVMLMHPNLYTVAEPLAAPDYLDTGDLAGLRVRVLQPRRSAATPWLSGLLDHLALHGAAVSRAILENLREGYWARETPTEFEIAESRRMDAMLLRELNAWECK